MTQNDKENMMDIAKSKQKVHIRTKGKKTFTAGTDMNIDKLIKLLNTTTDLVKHYLKKKALKK